MEGITVGQALEVFASETKRCAKRDRKRVLRFLHSALEDARRRGAYGWLREWHVCVKGSCFNLPKDCANVLSYKYNELHRGELKSPIYSYTSNPIRMTRKEYNYITGEHQSYTGSQNRGTYRGEDCPSLFDPDQGQLIRQANPSVFECPFPKKPGYLSFISSDEEDCDKAVQISGCFKGKRVVPKDTYCEHIPIGHKCHKPQKTLYLYDEVNSIKKPETCGFVSAIYESKCGTDRRVLATYDPLQCVPTYKRVRGRDLSDCCHYSICLLGILDTSCLKTDCDMIPIESWDLLTELARRQKAKDDGDRNLANAILVDIISIIREDLALLEGNEGEINFALEGSFASLDRIEN